MVATIDYLKTYYQGKKVLLTGHTGFKGSWLLKILSMLGADVMGFALAPESGANLYELIDGDKLCESVIADLRNREALHAAVSSFQPDYIFHLAAQSLVRLSYEIPSETFEVNAIGTANLLDAAKQLNKPCNLVLITTDKVYQNNEWTYPYRENDRLGGYDPYSASKACTELVIDSYRNSFFNLSGYANHKKALAVARAGNVIGGGDWSKDRLVPDIVKALSRQDAVIVRNPRSVRPWQHVLEPLAGYLLLGTQLAANPLKFSGAFNFGPHFTDSLPVIEMVKTAISKWGAGSFEVHEDPDQPHEAALLKLDISKALIELGWQPKFDAAQAVAYTIDWYKKWLVNPQSAATYTEKQIIDFLA
ncbi:CDP-glucose 4,6-dehydratase [Mucilaginibacter terrenus]|uniref:CDP-glucose 4,6-dehydratase n=1 Tax=Mucilaginibacter terrenus TaxID=2482727 RepID=A0A3E2NUY5_9SPHI|nr:CDP-glucose 4,6-dehydratase [Mucilaginibacter terrenus]RFZ84815.1 CDP-glucose 4,6-dehydratase [Mucilaginibacter terrenus]